MLVKKSARMQGQWKTNCPTRGSNIPIIGLLCVPATAGSRCPKCPRRRALPKQDTDNEDAYDECACRKKNQEPSPPFTRQLEPIYEESDRHFPCRDSHNAEDLGNKVQFYDFG